jgi:hypothetical protein
MQTEHQKSGTVSAGLRISILALMSGSTLDKPVTLDALRKVTAK